MSVVSSWEVDDQKQNVFGQKCCIFRRSIACLHLLLLLNLGPSDVQCMVFFCAVPLHLKILLEDVLCWALLEM